MRDAETRFQRGIRVLTPFTGVHRRDRLGGLLHEYELAA
jgi:hypothetical protein